MGISTYFILSITKEDHITINDCLASPHLNGKVERTQQTDKTEFWSFFDLADNSLDLVYLAVQWQKFYNKKRSHSVLNGKTPYQELKSVENLIPIQPNVTSSSGILMKE